MKVAVLLRGQPRQTVAGSELLRHFLIDRFPHIEFSIHIYSWTSKTPSTAGVLGDSLPYFCNKNTLYNDLKSLYNPVSISVSPDNIHYRDIVFPLSETLPASFLHSNTKTRAGLLYWKTSQLLAHMRLQSQLAHHCIESDYRPDLIVDTRMDIAVFPLESAFDTILDYLATHNNIIVNRLYQWSNHRAVSDDVFLYNFYTLLKLTQRTPEQRYADSYASDMKVHKSLNKHNIYNSHTLFPLMCFDSIEPYLIDLLNTRIEYNRLYNSKLSGMCKNKDSSVESFYSIMDKILPDDNPQNKHSNTLYTRLYNKLYTKSDPDNS